MTDIEYTLQGVPLQDDRWADPAVKLHTHRDGVWELLESSSILPGLPGFSAHQFQRAGQDGESQAQHAPIRPKSIPLGVRFWALDTDTQSPSFQRGLTEDFRIGQRARLLEANVNEFLFRTQIMAAGSKGLLRLSRRLSGGEWRHALGRVITSSDPTKTRSMKRADYQFLFHILSGTWFGETEYRSATIPQGGTTYGIHVPMGTAPVVDVKIAIRPQDDLPSGARVLNDMGVGFQTMRPLPAGQWTVIDAGRRRTGTAGSAAAPRWDADFQDSTLVAEYGPPMGSLLRVNPGVQGRSGRIGLINLRLTGAAEVQVAIAPRYV